MQAPCGAKRGMSSIRKAVKTLPDILNSLFIAIRNTWRTWRYINLLLPPPPPPPHHGATMYTAKKCFCSSPTYLTVLLLELEKRNLHSYGPVMGPIYHFDSLAFPTANDFCHIWLKLDNGFWRNRRNKYFSIHPPPPPSTCYPPMDPIGPPQELSWIFILHLKRYLHTI